MSLRSQFNQLKNFFQGLNLQTILEDVCKI